MQWKLQEDDDRAFFLILTNAKPVLNIKDENMLILV